MTLKPEDVINDLSAKYKVSDYLVVAMLGNAALMLAISADFRKHGAYSLKVDTMIHEYAQRWIILTKPLNVEVRVMQALVQDCTTAAADLMRGEITLGDLNEMYNLYKVR